MRMWKLFALYEDRLPASRTLYAYWFERARMQLSGKGSARWSAGDQSIRGGANRDVLERIKKLAIYFGRGVTDLGFWTVHLYGIHGLL